MLLCFRMWTKSNFEGFEKVDAGNYALFVESGKQVDFLSECVMYVNFFMKK